MPQLWAVSMFKDEVDVAAGVIRHLVGEGCAGIVVADNMSSDGTRDALSEVRRELQGECQVVIVDDAEPGYYQSRKMTDLAHQAASYGAEWILPFDADELWYARGDRLAVVLKGTRASIVRAPLYNHFCSGVDPEIADPFQRMVYRQPEPGALPKVLFRYDPSVVIHQGNHDVSLERSEVAPIPIELRHFPYRSFEHFRRKAINGAAAYAATDLDQDMGRHWRQYGELHERYGDAALQEVYDTWFNFLAPVNAGLIYDPAPYQRWTS